MKLAADIKTHFSIGESLVDGAVAAKQAAELGYEAAVLADTMTISAMPGFTKACVKHGIKPIIGVRLRIVETLDKVQRQKAVFPKLYIMTREGFEIVTALLTLANDDDHFYYVPRLTWPDVYAALDNAEGHIAYSTGSLYSAIRDKNASDMLKEISARLGAKYTFSEVVPAESAVWDRQAEIGYRVAQDLGLPVLLSRPVIYEVDGAGEVLDFMAAIASNSKTYNKRTKHKPVLDNYALMDPKSLVTEAVAQVGRLCSTSTLSTAPALLRNFQSDWNTLCNGVQFLWKKFELSLPVMAVDENAELIALAKTGLAKRFKSVVFGHTPSTPPEYVERLKYELDVLTKMGFAGYFLLTREIVVWAKSQGILVGPGRGSVGGSLVAYALEITDVDPIRFGLIFERFINPERLDLPDADLDFMSTRRHEIIGYIEQRFGKDRVAGISNYSTLQSRGAIQDVTRILDLDIIERSVSKLIPDEHGTPIPLERAVNEVAAVKSFSERQPLAWLLACELEGMNRSLSRHAAGIIAAGEPIVKRAVIERRSGEPTVNWDKDVVEDMGLVKMDILGLSTLDLMFIAQKKIKERHGIDVDLSAIPIDDPKVLEAFSQGLTVGVFQFESSGMRRLLKNLAQGGALTFEDISAATALYRPGPMDSGLLEDFVNIKQGMMSEHYEHPNMQAALEETYSVIVYQEQVMRIARDLCGFTMAEADHLRKAIGKKDPVKMAEQGDRFISGAITGGLDKIKAQELWDKIVKFAGYAFNKSHSVEYSLISYQSMWLKIYYTPEFFAAALTILGDEKKPGLIKDAMDFGIRVQSPDVNVSTDEFEILDDKTLAAPFNIIKGISEAKAREIIRARETGPFTSIEDLKTRTVTRIVNSAVIKNLDAIGAFARIEPNQRPASDPSRREAQLELTPTIVTGGVIVTRDPNVDKLTIAAIVEAIKDTRDKVELAQDGAEMTKPMVGKSARFMAVFDGPGYSEEREGQFTKGKSFGYIAEVLYEVGLTISDGYWTGMSKLPKPQGQKLWPQATMKAFEPLFQKELELVNPQVVIILGTNALRYFQPRLKGGIVDHAGKIIYMPATGDKQNDRNLVIGINPAMISFDEAKRELLVDAFKKLAEMIE